MEQHWAGYLKAIGGGQVPQSSNTQQTQFMIAKQPDAKPDYSKITTDNVYTGNMINQLFATDFLPISQEKSKGSK